MIAPPAAVRGFLFAPATAMPFAVLRIGLAGVLLAQAVLVRHDILAFLASTGLVQGSLAEYMSQPFTPRLAWVVRAFAEVGVGETTCIHMALRLYLCSLILFLIGLFTRPATFAVFTMQWLLANSGYMNSYGFDMYAHIFLFYLLWAPAGAALSVDSHLSAASFEPQSARLLLRVMQIHIAIAYAASAIEKATIPRWWNGELVWRILLMPEYRQMDMTWLANWPILPTVAGWCALALEGLFCVFIWPRRTRLLWVALITGMHLWISVFLGLQLFGAIMCVLVISLFAVSPEVTPSTAEVLRAGEPREGHGRRRGYRLCKPRPSWRQSIDDTHRPGY